MQILNTLNFLALVLVELGHEPAGGLISTG
jgi:hypothetical protein